MDVRRDALGSRTLRPVLPEREFDAVTLAERVNAFAVGGALVDDVLLACGVHRDRRGMVQAGVGRHAAVAGKSRDAGARDGADVTC